LRDLDDLAMRDLAADDLVEDLLPNDLRQARLPSAACAPTIDCAVTYPDEEFP
jgi:hypothetical protein